MKRSGIIIVLLLALIAGACSKNGSEGGHDHAEATQETYTCPMHPSVISDRPGACPVCGMALVKKSEQKAASDEELKSLAMVSLSPTQRVIANIATIPVGRRSLDRTISAVGVVDFAEPLRATVASRFRGRIEKIHVDFTGEVVRKGQPLFDLYSPDLLTAEQDYLIAIEALERAKESKSESNTQVQEKILRAALQRLRIHFGLTEKQVEELEQSGEPRTSATFYSPIHGTVLRKDVLEGQYVDEGLALYELADLTRVWVYLDVYEKDMRFVRAGQKVEITTDAYPGEVFPGRVTFVDPVLKADSRTVRVRAEFANPGGRLKPNMYTRASLRIAAGDVIVVPTSAILSTGRRTVVWIEVAENRFEPRDVVTGVTNESFTEILSGLSEGESVVATGGYLLDSESQLQQPAGIDPHAGHDASHKPAEVQPEKHVEMKKMSKKKMDEVQEVRVTVEYGYEPEVIRVTKGRKVRLLFHKKEESACTDEVLFKDFNIRKKLAAFKTTAVEFTPDKAGSFEFSCGMEMLFGKLIVEEK